MLTLTFDLELDLSYSYADVGEDAWYAQYAGVAELYELFPERTDELMPADPLTRYEVAVAIYQYLLNRDATGGEGEGEGEGEEELVVEAETTGTLSEDQQTLVDDIVAGMELADMEASVSITASWDEVGEVAVLDIKETVGVAAGSDLEALVDDLADSLLLTVDAENTEVMVTVTAVFESTSQ
jgi:hypothetical protein